MGILSFFQPRKEKPTPAESGFRLPEDVLENARAIYAGIKKELSDPETANRFTEIVTSESPLRDIVAKDIYVPCSILIAEKALSGVRPEGMLPEIEPLMPGIDRQTLLRYVRACSSTAMSALIQVRSERFPVPLYVWKCVKDERSNPAHVAMDGVICSWKEAPTLGDGKLFHPGRAVGCRCRAAVVVDLEDVSFPARCFAGGKIVEAGSPEDIKKVFGL